MSEPRRRLRLTRAMRLRRGCEFARLKNSGRRAATGCLIANWLPLPPGSSARLGVITSRKVGHAAHRSRARRLLREAFRLTQDRLNHPLMLVLIARPSIVGRSMGEVQRHLLDILARAGLLAAGPKGGVAPAGPAGTA